jgi:Ser/Thr protein kinase RdoA (MazF antagonist)
VNSPDVPLDGGGRTDVRRSGDVVLRPARPWSRTVAALLRHLEDAGYEGSPRLVGDGFDDQGREALRWVDGQEAPACWTPEGAYAVGALVRGLHDATATFVPPDGATWQPWWVRDLPGDTPVIGHADTGPWNVVARDGMPVAFVDWETAGPMDAEWELAQTAWLHARLHDDDIAERDGLPDATTRAGLVTAVLDGYRASRTQRERLAGLMLDLAVLSAREDAVEGLDRGVAWRARSAAWMVRHRDLIRRACAP